MWKKNPKPGCEYFFVLPISADVFEGCQDGNSTYFWKQILTHLKPQKNLTQKVPMHIPQKISAN